MRHHFWLRGMMATWTALGLAAAVGLAQDRPNHPIVPGFERFGSASKTDPVRAGQLLLGELNCVSCHQADDAASARKPAPVLDHLGSRVRIGHLRKFLRDPRAVKPGTTMPSLFAGDADRDAKVEALVHYLATTGSVRQERPDLKGIATGRDLYHKVGCVACHGSRDTSGQASKVLPWSVPLGDVKAKYSIASLAAFLENPHQSRPGGRMPQVVTGKDAKDIANYLLQGIKVDLAMSPGTSQYAYYEGTWDRLPNFDKLKPAAQGMAAAFDLGVARRGNGYAIRFDGFFKLDRDGTYRFTLHSDDGSKLLVDGQQVVDNDGVHAPKSAAGSTKLAKGIHQVTIGFFQAGGGVELTSTIEGPGMGSQDLASLVAASAKALEKPVITPKKTDDEDYLDVQPELVEKGRALFASVGCASCHSLTLDGKTTASTVKAVPLGKLKGEGACLGDAPVQGLPWYALGSAQKSALTTAIRKPAAPGKEPAEVIARTLMTFNCYACHARDKVGGPDEEINPLFQTTQPEMGDEARIPPPLDLVGAKLLPAYLKQILDKGSRDRPYMHTRMPAFGQTNVGMLADAFAASDRLPPIADVPFIDPIAKVKAAGRHMVGGQALGCIKCHTFAGHKAEGVQGIDMTVMTQRLHRDWFYAYLLDPQKVRPGTRMPTAWPDGKSVLPNLLDGKAFAQIESIWVYLKEGKGAQLPIGLQKQSIPLVPLQNAIIYRNFIQGSGPRAIGVGYPEKVNLTFDANDMRLSLLWQGAFIDAARHWIDRGSGFEGPLGDNILGLHGGTPFAVLVKGDQPWPAGSAREQGYQFRGYRLTPDDRPTFLCAWNDIRIEDFPNAVPGKEGVIRRTLSLQSPKNAANLYLRAAVGTKIEAKGDGWYQIDGWKMKIESTSTPQVRQAGGKAELLVPIHFSNGKAQVVQEYVW